MNAVTWLLLIVYTGGVERVGLPEAFTSEAACEMAAMLTETSKSVESADCVTSIEYERTRLAALGEDYEN